MSDQGSTSPSWYNGAMRDSMGNMAFPPIVLARCDEDGIVNPSRCLGVLRQVYNCENSRPRQVFQNSEGTDLAYAVSGWADSEASAIALSNS